MHTFYPCLLPLLLILTECHWCLEVDDTLGPYSCCLHHPFLIGLHIRFALAYSDIFVCILRPFFLLKSSCLTIDSPLYILPAFHLINLNILRNFWTYQIRNLDSTVFLLPAFSYLFVAPLQRWQNWNIWFYSHLFLWSIFQQGWWAFHLRWFIINNNIIGWRCGIQLW